MADPEPIYTADNCHLAYQLNWSLSLFATCEIPDQSEWLEPLREATESDGVRILEFHQAKPRVLQFFTSTKPHVAPAQVIRSVKGRLQNLIRDELPKAFRRNYRIESVGEVNNGVLQAYVAGQADRHRMAEARVQELFESLQLFDPQVDLEPIRKPWKRGGQAHFAPKTPQNEPVPGGFRIGSYPRCATAPTANSFTICTLCWRTRVIYMTYAKKLCKQCAT